MVDHRRVGFTPVNQQSAPARLVAASSYARHLVHRRPPGCRRAAGPGPGRRYLPFRQGLSSQYTSQEYAAVCERLRITQSMGSVGDSYDNAMAESFFSSLKGELVDVTRFNTIADARLEVFEWVIWYNRKRLHSSLGYLTPEEFEEQFNDQQAA